MCWHQHDTDNTRARFEIFSEPHILVDISICIIGEIRNPTSPNPINPALVDHGNAGKAPKKIDSIGTWQALEIVPVVLFRLCTAGVPRGIIKHAGQGRIKAECNCAPLGGLLEAVQAEGRLSLLDMV